MFHRHLVEGGGIARGSERAQRGLPSRVPERQEAAEIERVPDTGIPPDRAYIGSMTKPPPSPAQQARSERMRTAAIEGAKARADIEARDIAVRKNMERLRALRLAKEAEEAAQPKPAKAQARGKKAAPKQTAKLSDFLAAQKSNGRTT
jgi:hypothetical protein